MDGERLSEIEDARLREHLAACLSCRSSFSRELEQAEVLELALAEAAPPAPLEERILRAARQARSAETGRGPAPRLLPTALWPLAYGLLGLGLLAGGWWWWSSPGLSAREAPLEILLEENSFKTDLVPTDLGTPVGRGILKQRCIILDSPRLEPRRGRPAGQLIFEGEREDTGYFRPASLQYR